MQIQEFYQSLPYYFASNIVPCLVAQHGVGKSSIIRQYADENNLQFVDIRLGQMADPGDLTGLPKIVNGVTKFNPTSLLPKAGKGILFLDEINRCGKDLSQAVFQLILDRKLGEYTLPDGWHIVAAMNPDCNEYSVSSFDDAAFVDRFAMIRLEPSVREFSSYMKKKGHDVLASFISENSQFLEKKVEFAVTVTPSRRSWEAVGRLMANDLPETLRLSCFSSLVGIEGAASFISYMDSQNVVTWDQVREDFPKVKKQIAKMGVAEVGTIIDQIEEWATTSLTLMGMVSQTGDDAFDKKENAKFTKWERNLCDFLKAIPKDLAFAAVHTRLCKKAGLFTMPGNRPTGILNHPMLKDHFADLKGTK